MNIEDKLCTDTWRHSSSSDSKLQPIKEPASHHSFTNFNDPSILDYNISMDPSFTKFNQNPGTNPNDQIKISDRGNDCTMDVFEGSKSQDWDPKAMLSNLSFLEQKIHQLQDLVHLIVGRRNRVQNRADDLAAQQQQLITADLTSIIVQLITTAGSLLPMTKSTLSSVNPSVGQPSQLNGALFSSMAGLKEQPDTIEDHELKDEEDGDEGENLPPGSYEILQLEKEEILAPHTHFCSICGKGFKRDANLRMHMRGHGDEYKTAAALAKPHKETNSEPLPVKRYSCPYVGCKRNKEHKKFQPLKTILCVKNHYKRTHCDKSYTCSRCNNKKFSVIADLKTHEKHCGKDRWLCSCGTTFSRKDKLFGHIALFQGHTPAIPLDEAKASGLSDRGDMSESTDRVGEMVLNFGSNVSNGNGVQNGVEDSLGYFSSINFEPCNLGGFHEFPRPPFDDSEGSFSFLVPAATNYSQKIGGASSSNDFQ